KPQSFNPRQIIYRVPYSLHSSFSELVQFVQALQPKALFSVSLRDNVALRERLGKYCSTEPVTQFEIPQSVQLCMESKRKALTMSGMASNGISGTERASISYGLIARASPSPLFSRSKKFKKKKGAVILGSSPS